MHTSHDSRGRSIFSWEAFRGLALPVFLFAAVLLALLTLSRALILPRVTSVEISGARHSAAELRDYAIRLQAQIAAQEGERDAFVLPMHDTPYRDALDRAVLAPSPLDVLLHALDQRSGLTDAPGAVALERAHYDADARELRLRGDVRNVGPRSMTVLAQYVEALGALPGVVSVIPPRFVREEDPEIGFHSPFTVTLQWE